MIRVEDRDFDNISLDKKFYEKSDENILFYGM